MLDTSALHFAAALHCFYTEFRHLTRYLSGCYLAAKQHLEFFIDVYVCVCVYEPADGLLQQLSEIVEISRNIVGNAGILWESCFIFTAGCRRFHSTRS